MNHLRFIDVSTYWFILFGITIFFTLSSMFIYYRLDKYDPEPPSQVLVAFFYGMITPVFTVPMFIGFRVLVGDFYDPLSLYFIEIVVLAPVLEEVVKAMILLKLLENIRLDGPMDGIIYGIAVGAGFSTVENLIYGLGSLFDLGFQYALQVSVIRGAFAFIGHPVYTALFGYGVGATGIGLEESPWKHLGLAVLFHLMWNGVIVTSQIYTFQVFTRVVYLLVVIAITLYYILDRIKMARKIEHILAEQGYYESEERSGYSVRI